ncbi:type I secretion system permease/ATPase [Iodobacter fluviatilis]|uniref:ATP-binding cassette subfamily C exporter for protease/lipase n=1 Tax=Iodobacter fluviatilis TaxID=537 RepID=A0A377SXR0_9NEIS|nr:type I secretion system permease/ATPase [Iodobacter fluviatilis]TCU85027.1 ATP-binding cassette subfamily C exporter for protease/lipase [Iodobacter fluviatilis]STR45289.1 Type I secretion system ATP-binding protein PrsD [Iodobacter fluviatilis]
MKKQMQPRSELAIVLHSLRQHFWVAGLFSFFINLLMLVPSIYMLQVYDRVLASRNETTLIMITIITLGLYGMMSLLEMIRSKLLVRISSKLDSQLNSRVFTAAFERNLKQGNGDAGLALADLTNIRQFLTGQGLFAFFDAPWAPIYLAVLFMLGALLGWLAVVGAILLTALAYFTEMVSKKPLAEASTHANLATRFANNNLRNAEVIEAMGMLDGLMKRWYRHHGKFLALQGEASDKAGGISAVTKFTRISLQSLILGAGALLVIEGSTTPGAMIAGSILMGRALAPIELAIGSWKQFIGVRTAYSRLQDLLTAYPARNIGMSLPRPSGQLLADNISAAIPGTQNMVIKNMNFGMAAGQILGIIGPSACGKSTLARLLVGVWPTVMGKVRLDGVDVYTWSKAELGPYIGYLPQDIELFSGTIAENIARFGEIDSEKVVAAAQMADVHEMILRLPQGYDTAIGEGGAGLSGGQRQRVGLARALYGMPSLIVLDEPNANLDDNGERALVQAILRAKESGATVVLITHRTHVLAVVDLLLVMADGMLKYYGPRDQVLAALTPAVAAQPEQQTTA